MPLEYTRAGTPTLPPSPSRRQDSTRPRTPLCWACPGAGTGPLLAKPTSRTSYRHGLRGDQTMAA
eukprot:3668384-Lingulodinium_polyedra.AAC.1